MFSVWVVQRQQYFIITINNFIGIFGTVLSYVSKYNCKLTQVNKQDDTNHFAGMNLYCFKVRNTFSGISEVPDVSSCARATVSTLDVNTFAISFATRRNNIAVYPSEIMKSFDSHTAYYSCLQVSHACRSFLQNTLAQYFVTAMATGNIFGALTHNSGEESYQTQTLQFSDPFFQVKSLPNTQVVGPFEYSSLLQGFTNIL